ncbi:MAG: hypothetical protein Kow00124_13670 [Anaerolineae bacterium]
MPQASDAETEFRILPLTFLQIYRAAPAILGSRSEHPGWLNRLRLAMRLHLLTAAYGAFDDETCRGWMFLRGWRQVLYIDTLVIAEPQCSGTAAQQLLDFANAQARDLNRAWLGAKVDITDPQTVAMFERDGFQQPNRHVLRLSHMANLPQPRNLTTLQPVRGAAAAHLRRRLTRLDLAAGDGDACAIPLYFLVESLEQRGGRSWVWVEQGRPAAYLHLYGPPAHPSLYIAGPQEQWGRLPLLDLAAAVVHQQGRAASGIDVQFGSMGHYAASRPELVQAGFEERLMTSIQMYRCVEPAKGLPG